MTDWNAVTEVLLAEPAFQDVPKQELARFLSRIDELELNHDEPLHIRSEPTQNTFLIVSGRFEVVGADGSKAKFSRGFLGEEAALGLDRYVATAMSRGKARVLVLPKAALRELEKHGPIVESLLDSFTRRFMDEEPDDGKSKPVGDAVPAAEKPQPLRYLFGWALAIIAPITIVWTLSGSETLPNLRAVYLLAVISVSMVMWMFRLLPDFVPALFAILCVILFGLSPPAVALGGFSSTTFFMALSIFGLSVVITVSGLSYRVLLWLLHIGPEHKAWYSISLFLTGLALTPVVPTTNGRIAILAPFTNDMLGQMGETAARLEGPRLTASVLGGASLLSAIFLSSKSVNFLIFGLLPLQEQARFQWLYWLYAASVCGAVLVVFYGLAVWLIFRNESKPRISSELVVDQLRILGPVTVAEWSAISGLGVLLVAFLTSSLHQIEVPWVALAILFSLLMFRFLSPADFRQRIDWTFLIFLASLIGLVAAMENVGLNLWLASNLKWLGTLMENNFAAFVAMLAVTIFVVRLALPINATVIIFATLLVPTAVNIVVNPWLVGIIILLLSESFIWPYQASYYLLYKSTVVAAAGVDNPRLAVLHAVEFLMKLAAIYASFPFWKWLGIL